MSRTPRLVVAATRHGLSEVLKARDKPSARVLLTHARTVPSGPVQVSATGVVILVRPYASVTLAIRILDDPVTRPRTMTREKRLNVGHRQGTCPFPAPSSARGASYRRQRVTSQTCQLVAPVRRLALRNSPIEPILLKFLRTLCGLSAATPPLTGANAPIHTLKRNSTTSPSCIT